MDKELKSSNWKDWRWQLKHSIKSLEKFEYLTNIKLVEKEKGDSQKTFEKFSLSITPYYLSVIDKSNDKNENAEMTDFATSFSHVSHNLSCLLLLAMENETKKKGIETRYTIAQLNSISIHKTFLCDDYKYSGTLIKNTNISEKN